MVNHCPLELKLAHIGESLERCHQSAHIELEALERVGALPFELSSSINTRDHVITACINKHSSNADTSLTLKWPLETFMLKTNLHNKLRAKRVRNNIHFKRVEVMRFGILKGIFIYHTFMLSHDGEATLSMSRRFCVFPLV